MSPVEEVPRAPKRRRAGAILGVTGEVLITLGVVVLLFLGYQIWWTDVVSNRDASRLAQSLNQEWATGIGGAPGIGMNGQPPELTKAPALVAAANS